MYYYYYYHHHHHHHRTLEIGLSGPSTGKQDVCLYFTAQIPIFDVCWTEYHFDNRRIKNELDASYYFIVLLIGSTCFRHYYAHHQELTTIMLITTLVVSFLVCCMLEVRCG